MIHVKTGVKSFGQATESIGGKTANVNNMSAQDMQKALGGENIGDVLNKIADPNYVDPSKKIRTVGNDQLDKDAFMKLMLAQMKNQDPTNPMQSHEMAAQLAQFTSVEQMQNMNRTLSEIKNQGKPAESYQALNFIGKSVAGDSSKVTRLKGDTSHDFEYSLPEVGNVQIKVRNEKGEIVRTVDLKNLKKGSNTWTWNGLNEQGLPTPAGEYQIFIDAKSSSGKGLAVKTDFDGVITGVNYTSDGPVLLIGTQSIKMKDVKKIVDPRLNKNGQILNSEVESNLKNQQGATQTNIQQLAAGDAPIEAPDVTETVSMSPDLMQKVQRQTVQNDSQQKGTR